jgi:chromate reductase
MIAYQIAVVIGSLRKDSFNRKLANAIVKLAPPEFLFQQVQISDLPLYNQDDDANQAESVKRLVFWAFRPVPPAQPWRNSICETFLQP